jgi:hypothetical protein
LVWQYRAFELLGFRRKHYAIGIKGIGGRINKFVGINNYLYAQNRNNNNFKNK